MAVGDYDLVAIGNGAKARAIALKAAKLNARVALVTSVNAWDRGSIESTIRQVNLHGNLDLVRAFTNQPLEDLEFLQSVGVDVIDGDGSFSDRQTLDVNLTNSNYTRNTRKLRSRRFVIVRDLARDMRKIVGLNEIEYLTYSSLFSLLSSVDVNSQDPDLALTSLTLIGGNTLNCAIAQMLDNLGVKIRILAESHILPEFDLDSARILQTHLELQGIEILTGCMVTGISDREIWVNTSSGTSKLPMQKHILIPIINDPDLNLSQAGIEVKDGEICVNSKLQTTNSHVYVCRYFRDIDIVLKNCLFLPIAAIAPSLESSVCLTRPLVAAMGLTEIEARLRYGRDLHVLQSGDHADHDLEFYKVLYRGNGEIVGAHFVGDRARELLAAMAMIVKNRVKLSDLKIGGEIEGTIWEIYQEISTNILIKNWRSPWYKFFNW